MIDIQLKILDIQSANPVKHSLYLKNDADYLKKVWPGTSLTTIPETEANSLKFLLKLGSNPVGEIPLTDFTKDWIHGSKEILGFRVNLAYRILLKRPQLSNLSVLQEKLKESHNSCRILTEKLKQYENSTDILDQYTQALEKFKQKEKELADRLKVVTAKKNKLKSELTEMKNEKNKVESELFIAREELQLEKIKAKHNSSNNIIITPPEEIETLKSETSFRFSFGPEGGSEDFEKNLEGILSEILEEKGIEQNVLQVSAGVFYLGKIRAQIKISDGDVLAYYKKNYIPIDEFLEINFQNNPRRSLSAERFRPKFETPNKLEKKEESQSKNLNSSMKIVQDIDRVLEYSTIYKNKY